MNVSKFSKNLSRFRLVSFDVTDTLLKFNTTPAIQYAKTAKTFGYNVDQNKLQANFKNEFKNMEKHYPNYGKNIENIQYKDWWYQLVINVFKASNANIPDKDLHKIAEKLFDLYATEECWKKIDGANEIVDRIKNEGKIIGIISNSDPRLHHVIKRMKLPEFDFIYTSYELGYVKPDKRVFDEVLRKFNVNENEALHIGDTLLSDYIGAITAGWYGIHITNFNDKWKKYNSNNSLKVNENHVFDSIKCLLDKMEKSDILW